MIREALGSAPPAALGNLNLVTEPEMRSVSDAVVVCVAEPGPQRVNRFSNRA
jgi:hypothetical protein